MSTLKPEQLDALLQGYKSPAELESLYSQLLQRMINRGLEAEMDAHLGYTTASAARPATAVTASRASECRATTASWK